MFLGVRTLVINTVGMNVTLGGVRQVNQLTVNGGDGLDQVTVGTGSSFLAATINLGLGPLVGVGGFGLEAIELDLGGAQLGLGSLDLEVELLLRSLRGQRIGPRGQLRAAGPPGRAGPP